MSRKSFLLLLAIIPMIIGTVAALFPTVVLNSKGVQDNLAAAIWVREVGVLLFAIGVLNFLMRSVDDARAVKALLITNLIIQAGLLPIEATAYLQGVLRLSGIAPNTILHLLLILALAHYLRKASAASK